MAASDEARSNRGAAADGLYPTVNRRFEWRSEMELHQLIAGLARTAPMASCLPGPMRIEARR